MGMFDNIKCEYPLPDCDGVVDFQTKSFGDGFVGGFMDDYTITKNGDLILHKVKWEHVEEKDRPYYGTPEWDNNPIFQMVGSLKTIPVSDDKVEYHGIVNIYTQEITGNGSQWLEYNIKFTDGTVSGVERVYREFG